MCQHKYTSLGRDQLRSLETSPITNWMALGCWDADHEELGAFGYFSYEAPASFRKPPANLQQSVDHPFTFLTIFHRITVMLVVNRDVGCERNRAPFKLYFVSYYNWMYEWVVVATIEAHIYYMYLEGDIRMVPDYNNYRRWMVKKTSHYVGLALMAIQKLHKKNICKNPTTGKQLQLIWHMSNCQTSGSKQVHMNGKCRAFSFKKDDSFCKTAYKKNMS